MYFDYSTFFLLLRLLVSDKNNPNRFKQHLPLMLILAVWALFNSLFLALDFILFPGFRKKTVTNPVFIVGNARSGTTYFHRLMCDDENRFISFHLWELLLPSITQQKTVHMIFRCYAKFFPSSFQRLVEWEKYDFKGTPSPFLSTDTGTIYTYAVKAGTNDADAWYLTTVDWITGKIVYQKYVGSGDQFDNIVGRSRYAAEKQPPR